MNAYGTPEAIAVGVVFVLVLILVAIGGSQVAANAGRASKHLADAAAIGTRVPTATTGTVSTAAAVRALDSGGEDPANRTAVQLGAYYAANLSQGQAIFWASFVAMVAGFALVFAGIIAAGANMAAAIVGGIAGVLSQFIAATFLMALRSTQAQSTAYAQTLVELRVRDLRAADDARATQLGLELLGAISGDGASALVNQTRAALAMGLIVKEPPPVAPSVTVAPTQTDDDARRPRSERARVTSIAFDAAAETGKRRDPAVPAADTPNS